MTESGIPSPMHPDIQAACAGLGPAWRVVKNSLGGIACPKCGAAQWMKCEGGRHPERVLAYAAMLRAEKDAARAAKPEQQAIAIADDGAILDLWRRNYNVDGIAAAVGRTVGEVLGRLVDLGVARVVVTDAYGTHRGTVGIDANKAGDW